MTGSAGDHVEDTHRWLPVRDVVTGAPSSVRLMSLRRVVRDTPGAAISYMIGIVVPQHC
jgi:hypothetical protein